MSDFNKKNERIHVRALDGEAAKSRPTSLLLPLQPRASAEPNGQPVDLLPNVKSGEPETGTPRSN